MHLSRLAEATPDKAAIIRASDGVVVTYAELDRRSLQVAQLLAHHGLRTGDHVAILMENRPEYLEVFWGAQRRGAYITPVNWHLTESEAGYVVNDCGARVLFTSATLEALSRRVAAACATPPVVVVVDTAVDTASDIDAQPAEPLPDETEGIYFFYSSGTTGVPKGIEPEHTFPPFGSGHLMDHVMHDAFGFTDDAVHLCPAPLYHSAPIAWSVGTTRNGGTVVLLDKFEPVECLRAIEHHGITHAQFVPTMFVRLLKLPPEVRAQFDVSSLRVVVHAAAPCPVDVKRHMIDWFGPTLLEFYAGSEGGGMTMITSADWLDHPGSVGRPALGAVHIVGDDGVELPPGEVGAVYFSGGGTFRYHGDEAKTAGAYNAQGWSTLGDLGYLDPDGYLFLADRRTDLIISGGVNIYPREIEEAVVMHASVADIAVIGVPDDEMGQRIKAVVQLAPGAVADDALRSELEAHCRERLAGFKLPREWEFVAELPRTEAGKLLRRRLRDGAVSG